MCHLGVCKTNAVNKYRDDNPVQPGNYYIKSSNSIRITDENALTRTIIKLPSMTQDSAFAYDVRQRDRGCVVTKVPNLNIEFDNWLGFEAAHIFPQAYSELWSQENFDQYITVPGPDGDNINSVQNRILLTSTLDSLFSSYHFSISPKHGYKIIYFFQDMFNIAGTHLSASFLSSPNRPPDELLNWHFRQTVLANMKGMGEPLFEHDFPTGCDMVGDILRGQKPAERMEFELFTRLRHLTEGKQGAEQGMQCDSGAGSG